MRDDDCQVEFYFSFEKCDQFGPAEFGFKKEPEKIGFLYLSPVQPSKNVGLPSTHAGRELRENEDTTWGLRAQLNRLVGF